MQALPRKHIWPLDHFTLSAEACQGSLLTCKRARSHVLWQASRADSPKQATEQGQRHNRRKLAHLNPG